MNLPKQSKPVMRNASTAKTVSRINVSDSASCCQKICSEAPDRALCENNCIYYVDSCGK